MSDALTPALKAIRQKEFYENPRFHASIGWALLDQPLESGNTSRPALTSTQTTHSDNGSLSPLEHNAFPTIASFPPVLIPTLKEEFGRRLISTKLSAFDVDHVYSKIGNEISRWRLLEA